MAKTQRPRNPLEPLTTTVTILSALTALWLGFMTLVIGFGSGSAFGWGRENHPACVDVNGGLLRIENVDITGAGLPSGSNLGASAYSLCIDHPAGLLRAGIALTQLPSTLLFLGFLLLVGRLLRGAQADGVHSRPTARRLQLLGWYLIGGSLTVATVEALALGAVLASQTPYSDWLSGVSQWHAPFAVVLAGIGLVTFARIMRIGATMSDDLEGTV
ncbi:hypothetical protein ACFYW6_39645 [Streptomyces sp. NPDC002659]|uniref:hypothetical protein n=1 Tax=Streptomyces sp. NPDC002659 TaxID=3364656 RepID=UPI0036A799B7